MPTKYLEMVKRYIDVTWELSDEEIIEMIEDGMNELRAMIHSGLEFNPSPTNHIQGTTNSLLKDYVRYARSGSTQYFRQDNLNRINTLTMLVAGDLNDSAQ